MDWSDSPDQAKFRLEVRAFIQDKLPEPYKPKAGEATGEGEGFAGGWQADRKSTDPKRVATAAQWATALADKGWIAPAWPKEYGGAGLSTVEQFIYNQEMAEAAAPSVGGMGVSMLGPTLIVHGSPEQKQEHLSRILSGEVAWAQGDDDRQCVVSGEDELHEGHEGLRAAVLLGAPLAHAAHDAVFWRDGNPGCQEP